MTSPTDNDAEKIAALLETHINRCRKAVAECPKWSAAQGEWSRARDALLNFQDDLRTLLQKDQTHD